MVAGIVRNLPWSRVAGVGSLGSTSSRPRAAFYNINASASSSFFTEPHSVPGSNIRILSSCPSTAPRNLTKLKTSWKCMTLCHTFLLVSELMPISRSKTSVIAGAAAMSTSSSSPTDGVAPDDVIQYWFKDVDPQKESYFSNWWFFGGPGVDGECKGKFGEALKIASSGGLNEWMDTARDRLALVILLDQISRNVYRNTPQSFAQDERAVKITLDTIEKGWDKELPPWQRWFLYMPLMHSENLHNHTIGARLLQGLVDETSTNEKLNEKLLATLNFQKEHTADIERFGRYPSRNAILGRPNTKEEEEYLASRSAQW